MNLTPSEVRDSLALFHLNNGKRVSVATLKALLPDIETALFFGKVYGLNYSQLSSLLRLLFNSTVLEALTEGEHSTELQDYLVDTIPEDVLIQATQLVDKPAPVGVLPEIWAELEVEVADSIAKVATELAGALDLLPGKYGHMVFQQMAKLNRQRNTIGSYSAVVKRESQVPNLVILDVSGSMSEATVRAIAEDVVALGYKANAHFAIVSDGATAWEPGSYNVDQVLASATYGGTHYETLTPLLNRSWGTVITIADYDSSLSAQEYIRLHAKGSIQQVLDLSLVNQPTFLAECLGPLASSIRPLLIGNTRYVLR